MSAWNNSLAGLIADRSTPEPNTGCWLWDGQVEGGGYGVAYVPSLGQMLAHRLSYTGFVGPIPDGLFVCHVCDQRCCVNPEHLWLGTATENTADMVRKGRQARHGVSATCFRGHLKQMYGSRWRCPTCHNASRRRNRALDSA